MLCSVMPVLLVTWLKVREAVEVERQTGLDPDHAVDLPAFDHLADDAVAPLPSSRLPGPKGSS